MALDLPENVQLLTLARNSRNNGVVVRLEHIFELGEDSELSLPATVSLQQIMKTLKLTQIEELMLGANVPKSHVERLKWKKEVENKRLKRGWYV